MHLNWLQSLLSYCRFHLTPGLFHLTAHVIAVPKKGSKHLTLGLYQRRGVSMTHQTIDQCRCYQIISKVMESIICDQIHDNLSKYQLLCDTQYGFREKRSIVDMLSYTTQWWNNTLDTQQEIRVIALDIKTAFDRVLHKGLMEKLSSFGIQ